MLEGFYYDRLNYDEKQAYLAIRSALFSRAANCTVYASSIDTVRNAWQAVSIESAEIIYYPALFCQPTVSRGSFTLSFEYFDCDESLFNAKLSAAVDKLLGTMPPGASAYTVCKAAFDYVSSLVTYDFAALRAFGDLEQTESAYEDYARRFGKSFTAYGALMDKKATCSGISALFKLLCDRLGVPCTCIYAKRKGSGVEHKLNLVEIDGKRAFVDCTMGLKGEDIPMIDYKLFLVGSDAVSRYYDLVADGADANDDSLGYYSREKLVFKSVSELRRYLESYVGSHGTNEIRVRYVGDAFDDERLTKFFANVVNKHSRSHREIITSRADNGYCQALIRERKKR